MKSTLLASVKGGKRLPKGVNLITTPNSHPYIRVRDLNNRHMLTIAATIAEDDLKVDSERQRWSFKRRFENGWISIGNGMYGYRMLEDNTLEIVPEEAAVVQRIFEMYINGAGSSAIAATLDCEGIPSRGGKGWRPQTILEMLANEKYMGDSLMGKSVTINGRQFDNMNGEYGQRYYMEDTHEGIISKETFALVQALRQQRQNKKLVGQPIPEYPFTGIIECRECGKHYQHKVNNSGKKWQNDIWCCATSLKRGVAACGCTRIKDSVLREKFIEAYKLHRNYTIPPVLRSSMAVCIPAAKKFLNLQNRGKPLQLHNRFLLVNAQ